MTQRELLVSTVKFYTSENTAVENGVCVYMSTPTSPGCAIGRYLTPEVQQAFHKTQKEDAIGSITSFYVDSEFKELLPDWMQKMDIRFLQSVQYLHDTPEYWDKSGITLTGKAGVNAICSRFTLDYLTEEEFKHENQSTN